MKQFISRIIIFIAVFSGVFLFSSAVYASVLSLNPPKQVIAPGERFIVTILLDGEGQVINTVEARVLYTQNILEVDSVSHGGSFLTLWPEEPRIDQDNGVLSFAGGIPNGSLVRGGRVLEITFRAKILGEATVRFDEPKTNVYLNDGHGTKTALRTTAGIYTIANPSPFLVNINSATHPDENTWYQSRTAEFKWDTKPEALYSYELNQNPLAEPDDLPETVVGSVSYDNVKDGIYYFSLKEKLADDGWGPISKKRVMIDGTSPQQLQYSITKEVVSDKYVLVFSAIDLASGVDYYRIKEGDKVYENATSPFALHDQTRSVSIKVQAFDKAGNMAEATIAPLNHGNTFGWWLTGIIALIILAFIILMAVTLKKLSKKH